ncbi:hypothetical protein AOB54_02890 [beta proteobacterium MWH-UniP1]
MPLVNKARPRLSAIWLAATLYLIFNLADLVQRGELFLIPAVVAISPALLGAATAVSKTRKLLFVLSASAYTSLAASILFLIAPANLWWGMASLPISALAFWKPRAAFVAVALHMIGLSAGYIQLGLQWR